MASSLGEGKLWIQTSCRPEMEWTLPDYYCPRYSTWIASPWPNQVTGPVRDRILNKFYVTIFNG